MDNTEILVAAMSDPEFKHRLAELREEQTKLAEQQKALQEQINQNAELVQEAQKARAGAASLVAIAQEKEQNARDEMEKAATAFAAVKAAEEQWNSNRMQVSQQQDDREKMLKAREDNATAREAVIDSQANQLGAWNDELDAKEKRHAAAQKHAAAFVAALDAPGS
jgi:hypothetical protein